MLIALNCLHTKQHHTGSNTVTD